MSAITPGDLGPFGNVFNRGMVFATKGDDVEFHCHEWDHVLIVLNGSLDVYTEKKDGRRNEVIVWSIESAIRTGPFKGLDAQAVAKGVYSNAQVGFVLIEATTKHRLVSREDLTVGLCTFAHRDAQGRVVQNYAQAKYCG